MNRRVASTLVGLLLGLSVAAEATLVRSATLEETIDASAAIVIGKVLSLSPYKLADGRIMTAVRVRVEESLAGGFAPGEVVRVSAYGGSFRGRQAAVLGAARYVKGESVLLQLEPIDGRLHTLGLAMGKWNVSEDPFGGRYLTRSLAGLSLAGRAPVTEGPVSLDEFRSLVARSRERAAR